MSIFLNFICLDCDRMGITCMLLSPEIDDSGNCLDFIEKAGEGTNQLTNEVS